LSDSNDFYQSAVIGDSYQWSKTVIFRGLHALADNGIPTVTKGKP